MNEKTMDFRAQVGQLMADLGAKHINECYGPDDTKLVFYSLKGRAIIVQLLPNNEGWTHYISSEHNTQQAAIDDLKALK